MSKVRLGDSIDDHCPRCRLLLDHNVASLVGEEVVKVVCRTCHNEHPYRHGKGGKKKKTEVESLVGEILARAPQPPPPPAPDREAKEAFPGRPRPLRRKV